MIKTIAISNVCLLLVVFVVNVCHLKSTLPSDHVSPMIFVPIGTMVRVKLMMLMVMMMMINAIFTSIWVHISQDPIDRRYRW